MKKQVMGAVLIVACLIGYGQWQTYYVSDTAYPTTDRIYDLEPIGDRLYLATNKGLYYWHSNVLRGPFISSDSSMHDIRTLCKDPADSNAVWVATIDGISRFDGVDFSRTEPLRYAALPTAYLDQLSMTFDGDGRQIVAFDSFVLGRNASGWDTLLVRHIGTRVSALDIQARSKTLWVAYPEDLYRFENGQLATRQDTFMSPPVGACTMSQGLFSRMGLDESGHPWFVTNCALTHLTDDRGWVNTRMTHSGFNYHRVVPTHCGALLCSTVTGLYYYDAAADTMISFAAGIQQSGQFPLYEVTDAALFDGKLFAVGTHGIRVAPMDSFPSLFCATDTVQISVPILQNDVESIISIYPNPASDRIIITSRETGTVTMYDIVGNKLWQDERFGGRAEINLSGIAPGMYLVSVNGNATMKKLVRQ